LTICAHHRKAPGLETHHQLKNSRQWRCRIDMHCGLGHHFCRSLIFQLRRQLRTFAGSITRQSCCNCLRGPAKEWARGAIGCSAKLRRHDKRHLHRFIRQRLRRNAITRTETISQALIWRPPLRRHQNYRHAANALRPMNENPLNVGGRRRAGDQDSVAGGLKPRIAIGLMQVANNVCRIE